MVIGYFLYLIARRKNVKYTVPQENLETDVSCVLISEEGCHTVVGLAYPTWTGEELNKNKQILVNLTKAFIHM